MEALALALYAAELAIMAIILWFVVEFLPMPTHMKRVTQLLIVMVAILSLCLAIGGRYQPLPPPIRSLGPTPSIIR